MFSVTNENIREVGGEGWFVFENNNLSMFVI
jgi:hypothetical protein